RQWPVRNPIDHQAARPANSLTAVVVERDRLFAAPRQVFIDDVEHLQEGHVRADLPGLVGAELSWSGRVLLPPDSQCQIQCLLLRKRTVGCLTCGWLDS